MKRRPLCIHCKHHALEDMLFDEYRHVCKLHVIEVDNVTGHDRLGHCHNTYDSMHCDFQRKPNIFERLIALANKEAKND